MSNAISKDILVSGEFVRRKVKNITWLKNYNTSFLDSYLDAKIGLFWHKQHVVKIAIRRKAGLFLFIFYCGRRLLQRKKKEELMALKLTK